MFSSWIFASFCISISAATKFDFATKEYSGQVSLPLFLLIFVSFFMLLTVLKKATRYKFSDDMALVFSTALYSIKLASQTDDIFVCMSIIAAVSAVIVAVIQSENRKIYSYEVPKKVCIACVAVFGVAMATFIGTVTVFRYLTFSSPNFDFGIFCNMFYNMAKDFTQTVSCERDRLLSHFAVHVSPVYYLILPIYMIFPHPVTLQVMQAIIVASGIVPVYLICRRRSLSNRATICFSAIYILFPALNGGCFYDIHENCFLAPFVMWLLYSTSVNGRKGLILKALFTVLTLSVKEDAFVYVIFVGAYMILSSAENNDKCEKSPNTAQAKYKTFALNQIKENILSHIPRSNSSDKSRVKLSENTARHITGICMIIVSVAYFAFTSWYLKNYGTGVMTNRYDNFINGDEGLLGAIKTILINPIIALTESFNSEKLSFAFYMTAPLAFLPFISKKPSRFILVMPFILVNMMPDYKYQHSIYFQYVFASSSFLIYAAIVNYDDISAPKLRHSLIAISLASSIICSQVTILGYSSYVNKYIVDKDRYIELEQALQTVPDDATVSSTTFYLPHLASRDEIYQCSMKDQPVTGTDYVVLDMRGVSDEEAKIYIEMYQNFHYVNTVYINELVLIFASDDYIEQHSNSNLK